MDTFNVCLTILYRHAYGEKLAHILSIMKKIQKGSNATAIVIWETKSGPGYP